jgi:acyl carrier protein
MLLIQKDFGFKARAEEFQGVYTVGAVADLVAKKLESQKAGQAS